MGMHSGLQQPLATQGEEPFCMTDAANHLVALADRSLPRAPLLEIQRPFKLIELVAGCADFFDRSLEL